MARTIDHREYDQSGETVDVESSQAATRELLLWRTVAKVADDTLVLDDGTRLTLRGNEGCGGCTAGHFNLTDLNGCPNAITAVEFDTADVGMRSTYRIFVYAEDQRIKLAEFDGWDNGYYGSGYWIEVS